MWQLHKGFRFFTMERLFYALQLLTLGDKKYIRQLAKYTRMDYVRKCVNTRFELASTILQDTWLEEQFQTWTQIITARILSDTTFKQALLDSAGSPLCEPDDPVYATALMSLRKMCVEQKWLSWSTWISRPTRLTRGQIKYPIICTMSDINTIVLECKWTNSIRLRLYCCIYQIEKQKALYW